MGNDSRLVYSTDAGRITPKKPASVRPTPSDGIVRLHRETKGRKGKGVTLITGLDLAEQELKAFASKLKQLCGTGGSVKDGRIEIQGEQREKLRSHLESLGFTVKGG
jgi:translation initiation factor 1